MSNMKKEIVEERVFNSIADYYEYLFNQISLAQFLPHKSFGGFGTNSVSELLTFEKIEIMHVNGEIDLDTRNNLKKIYGEYIEASKSIFNSCVILERYNKTRGTCFEHINDRDIKDIELEVQSLNAYIQEYKAELAKYNLPIRFDLASILETNTDDVTCVEDDDEAYITLCKTVNSYFKRNIHYSAFHLGSNKFSSTTVNEFLSLYKLYLLHKNDQLTDEFYKKLIDIYSEYLLMCEVPEAYDEAKVAEYKELLGKYGLPFNFDLDRYVNAYGNKTSKTKQVQ